MVVGMIEVSGCCNGSMRWAKWVGEWGLHLARVGGGENGRVGVVGG